MEGVGFLTLFRISPYAFIISSFDFRRGMFPSLSHFTYRQVLSRYPMMNPPNLPMLYITSSYNDALDMPMHSSSPQPHPSHDVLDIYTQSIRALNDYFSTEPIRHFDRQEKLVLLCDTRLLSHHFRKSGFCEQNLRTRWCSYLHNISSIKVKTISYSYYPFLTVFSRIGNSESERLFLKVCVSSSTRDTFIDIYPGVSSNSMGWQLVLIWRKTRLREISNWRVLQVRGL